MNNIKLTPEDIKEFRSHRNGTLFGVLFFSLMLGGFFWLIVSLFEINFLELDYTNTGVLLAVLGFAGVPAGFLLAMWIKLLVTIWRVHRDIQNGVKNTIEGRISRFSMSKNRMQVDDVWYWRGGTLAPLSGGLKVRFEFGPSCKVAVNITVLEN